MSCCLWMGALMAAATLAKAGGWPWGQRQRHRSAQAWRLTQDEVQT